MRLICPNPECKSIVSEHAENIDRNKRYVQCCYCGRHFENPLYEGEKE